MKHTSRKLDKALTWQSALVGSIETRGRAVVLVTKNSLEKQPTTTTILEVNEFTGPFDRRSQREELAMFLAEVIRSTLKE